MMRSLAFVLWTFVAFIQGCSSRPAIDEEGSVVIHIAVDPKAPESLRGWFDVPTQKSEGPYLTAISRTTLAYPSQVREVQCDGVSLQPEKTHAWAIPSGCKKISWEARLESAAACGSPQPVTSQYLGAQRWIIQEATALLRLHGLKGEQLLEVHPPAGGRVHSGMHRVSSTRFKFPMDEGAAPEPLLVGKWDAESANADGTTITHYVDRPDAFDLKTMLKIQSTGLKYLSTVVGREQRGLPPVEELGVYWLCVNPKDGTLSGQASEQTLIVRYLHPADGKVWADFAGELMTLFHEQFHQLQGTGLPVWLGESLAQYYGLKTLQRHNFSAESAAEFWGRFVNDKASFPKKLLAIDKDIRENQDYSNYGLLYAEGANFWHQVDTILRQKSGGSSDLDHLVPQILTADYKGGTDSSAVIELLKKQGGPQLVKEMKKYLD